MRHDTGVDENYVTADEGEIEGKVVAVHASKRSPLLNKKTHPFLYLKNVPKTSHIGPCHFLRDSAHEQYGNIHDEDLIHQSFMFILMHGILA